jgi:hypothetical protein
LLHAKLWLGLRLGRMRTFVDKFLGVLTENIFQGLVGNIPASKLSANDPLAIDERDVGHESTDHRTDLHEIQRVQLVRHAHRKRRQELALEELKIGLGIEGAFQNFEAFWSKILLNATQNLSGFLAMRSSGEDEGQAQNFAAIARNQRLSAVRKLHGQFGRLAWNVSGEGGAEKH